MEFVEVELTGNWDGMAVEDAEIIDDKAISKGEVLDLLNEEDPDDKKDDKKDDKVEDKDKKEDDKKEEDDEDEEKELKIEDEDKDDEDEELDEEKLELVVPARKKEILAKYPKLFKDFPYLEKAYYRDQQYTEILPTIADAKEAVEKAGILESFEQDLVNGDTTKILSAAKKGDPDGFNKLVDNYMESLASVDKDAYYTVTGNIAKRLIYGMVKTARENKDEDLEKAAVLVNKFFFNTTEFQQLTRLGKEESKDTTESDKLKKDREAFEQRKFESSRDDLQTKVDNTLKNTLDNHIDPKKSMSNYVKNNAIKDCQNKLEDAIKGDKRFLQVLDSLWKRAANDNYSRSSLDKIKSAYLSKAKTLLPSIISTVRKEALKGNGSDKLQEEEKEEVVTRRSTPSSNRGKEEVKSKKKQSTLEFFNS